MSAVIGYDDKISKAALDSPYPLDTPLSNLANGQTWNAARWQNSGGNSYEFTAEFDEAVIDYMGVQGHNLAEATAITIQLRIGGTYQTVATLAGAPTSGPWLHQLPQSYSATGFRLAVTLPGNEGMRLAVVMAGEALPLPEPITGSFTPPRLSRTVATYPLQSSQGHYMGSRRTREGWTTKITQSLVQPSWINTYYLPLITTIEAWPFFYIWDNTDLSQVDTMLCWLHGQQSPPSYSDPVFMGFTLNCRAVGSFADDATTLSVLPV